MSLLTFAPVNTPITGGETLWHTRDRDQSLVTRPVPDERVEVFLKHLLSNGQYVFSPEQILALSEIISMCQEQDVPIMLVEIPVADLLIRHWPPGTRENFHDVINEVANEMNVPFINSDQLDTLLTEADFLEQSHLNRTGAVKFSTALAKDILAPGLRKSGDAGRSSSREN